MRCVLLHFGSSVEVQLCMMLGIAIVRTREDKSLHKELGNIFTRSWVAYLHTINPNHNKD